MKPTYKRLEFQSLQRLFEQYFQLHNCSDGRILKEIITSMMQY